MSKISSGPNSTSKSLANAIVWRESREREREGKMKRRNQPVSNWFNIQPRAKSGRKNETPRGRLKYFRIYRGSRDSRGKHAWVRSQLGDRGPVYAYKERGFSRSFEVAGRANGTWGSAECRPSGWQYPCPVLSSRIILPYLSRATHSQTLIPCPFSSFATARPLSRCLETLSRLEHPGTPEKIIAF